MDINCENDSNQEKLKILGSDSLQNFLKDGYKTLMESIKHANNLPQDSDWNFYNTHEGFVRIINEESDKILKQINCLLRTNDIEGNVRNRGLEEKTELIIEGNDNILERVAINIDEMNGIRKTGNAPILIQSVSAELPINGSWNRLNSASFSVTSSITTESTFKPPSNAIRLLTAKNIIRPQTFFKDKIVNSSNLPWEPRIKEKPNSLKPLAIFLEDSENGLEFSHPYEYELDRFQPLAEQLQKEIPKQPLPIKDTPLIEVNEEAQLNELVESLRQCKIFAVDLEHHSYRSFMGITCLMQISTNEKDYLIDTLTLRDKLWMLNEVFTKPTIVKVFHGAIHDIQWLQRDLSIYVVNMFDTHEAAKLLEFSGLSLAYLLQKYCKFIPNKQFQLADWRIRPLPNELKSYAREDTHYLIYIYQILKNELLEKANGFDNLLLSVINRSTAICKQRYFKPVLKEDSFMDFYRKCKRLFDNRQLYALKELYKWRDQLSREEDESTGYVLPNHMMLQISETLPREMQGILACCNPIPPLVRANLLELHHIILRTKEQPLEKPILKEDTRARGTTKKISKMNVDSPLNCPHDLTKHEFRDNLQTVLGSLSNTTLTSLLSTKLKNESDKSTFSVFFASENSDDEEKRNKIKEKMKGVKYLEPFERYKLVKPYIQAEEERLAKQALEDNSKVQNVDQVETRTDEERIESIRELFLSLSKKDPSTNNPKDPDRSLIQMGGTKRKREHSPVVPEQSVSVHPVVLPISSERSNKNENSRKRKWSENQTGATTSTKFKIRKSKRLRKNQGNNNEEDESEIMEENPNCQKPKYFYRKKRNNKKKEGGEKSTWNNEQEFTPYDYSSVDFRQFQGGAGSISKPQEFKSTIRFKGKKRNSNGNNNRSSTFGINSQSRGRGRGHY